MKLALLSAIPNIPLIDIAGGYVGPYSGEVPVVNFVKRNHADFLVSPHDWWDIRNNKEFRSYLISMSHSKPVFLFNRGDFPGRLPGLNGYYFQNTLEVGSKNKGCVILPYNVQDCKDFYPMKFESNPVISFVGYVPKITPGRIYRSFFPNPHPLKKNSALVRKLLIHQVKKQFNSINIIERKHYGGARKLIEGDPEIHRSLFLDAISNSHFSLCPRGDGNGSQRFFETLAAGRIPVVPNTSMILPVIDGSNSIEALYIRTLSFDIKRRLNSYWNEMNSSKLESISIRNHAVFQNRYKYSVFMRSLIESSVEDFERKYVLK